MMRSTAGGNDTAVLCRLQRKGSATTSGPERQPVGRCRRRTLRHREHQRHRSRTLLTGKTAGNNVLDGAAERCADGGGGNDVYIVHKRAEVIGRSRRHQGPRPRDECGRTYTLNDQCRGSWAAERRTRRYRANVIDKPSPAMPATTTSRHGRHGHVGGGDAATPHGGAGQGYDERRRATTQSSRPEMPATSWSMLRMAVTSGRAPRRTDKGPICCGQYEANRSRRSSESGDRPSRRQHAPWFQTMRSG